MLQGLSLVVSSYNGEDVIVAFGGYNGRYNNEVKSNINVFAFSFLCLDLSLLLVSCIAVRFMFLNQAINQLCHQR